MIRKIAMVERILDITSEDINHVQGHSPCRKQGVGIVMPSNWTDGGIAQAGAKACPGMTTALEKMVVAPGLERCSDKAAKGPFPVTWAPITNPMYASMASRPFLISLTFNSSMLPGTKSLRPG